MDSQGKKVIVCDNGTGVSTLVVAVNLTYISPENDAAPYYFR